MKHQRVYLILAGIVSWLLPRLDFTASWQRRVGQEALWFLNALGARWIYLEVVK